MKLLVSILLVAAACSRAIDLDYLLPDYGFKVGLSLANQDFSVQPGSQLYYIIEGGHFKPRPGLTAGIYAEWFDEPYINLITELSYVQKGTIFSTGGVTNHEYNNRLDYLSMPVMARFKYPDFDFLPYLLFGVRYDHLLHRSIESEVLLYDKSKSGNLGTTLGCGFQFEAGGFPLLAEYTLHNQYANLLEDEIYLYTARNVSHSLVLGYRFGDLFDPLQNKRAVTSKPDGSLNLADTLLQEDDFISFSSEQLPAAVSADPPGYTASTLAFRSMLLPGAAQFSTGRYYAGAAYSLLFVGALYFCYDRIENYNRQVDEWQAELNKITPASLYYDAEKIQLRCNEQKKEIDNYEKTIYYGLAGLTGIYLAGILDGVLFAPEDQLRVSVSPQISPQNPGVALKMELDL